MRSATWKRVVPDRLHPPLRRARRAWRRSVQRPRWGNLRRLRPFSDRYGLDRGDSVDRPLIDNFVARHAADLRGHTLEVLDTHYTGPAGAVTRRDVLDVDPTNPDATVVADLGRAGALGGGAYDCIVVTQTLQLIADLPTALGNLWGALAPAGTLLLSVPVLCRVDPDWGPDGDYWRFTPAGLRHVLAALEGAEVTVEGHGNLALAIGFLAGLSAQEMRPEHYGVDDPAFPIVACARVRRPASP